VGNLNSKHSNFLAHISVEPRTTTSRRRSLQTRAGPAVLSFFLLGKRRAKDAPKTIRAGDCMLKDMYDRAPFGYQNSAKNLDPERKVWFGVLSTLPGYSVCRSLPVVLSIWGGLRTTLVRVHHFVARNEMHWHVRQSQNGTKAISPYPPFGEVRHFFIGLPGTFLRYKQGILVYVIILHPLVSMKSRIYGLCMGCGGRVL
jgi:hypothetical protein